MTRLRLRLERLEWLESDGDVLALDRDDVVYLGTNATGALLWRLLAAGTTRAALIDDLRSTFSVGREQATSDVDAFLSQLSQRGLLEEEE